MPAPTALSPSEGCGMVALNALPMRWLMAIVYMP